MAKTGKRKHTRPRRRRQRGGKFNFQKAIGKTGMEFHIPSYRFAGPGTRMAKRLKGRDKPKNKLDRIAMYHDIAYSKTRNLQDKWKADDVMIRSIDRLPWKMTMTEKANCNFFFLFFNKCIAFNCLFLTLTLTQRKHTEFPQT